MQNRFGLFRRRQTALRREWGLQMLGVGLHDSLLMTPHSLNRVSSALPLAKPPKIGRQQLLLKKSAVSVRATTGLELQEWLVEKRHGQSGGTEE